jgi:hypothetical protein
MSPQTIAIAAAVVVVFLLAIAGLVWMRSGGPTQPSTTPVENVTTTPTTQPPTTTTSDTPTTVPPAAPGLTTVFIDIRPWARIKVVPTTPNPSTPIPSDTFYAPFAVDLPPGDYTLEAENGGVTRATKFELKVGEGAPMTFVRNMPGFNATKIVESLLGQD